MKAEKKERGMETKAKTTKTKAKQVKIADGAWRELTPDQIPIHESSSRHEWLQGVFNNLPQQVSEVPPLQLAYDSEVISAIRRQALESDIRSLCRLVKLDRQQLGRPPLPPDVSSPGVSGWILVLSFPADLITHDVNAAAMKQRLSANDAFQFVENLKRAYSLNLLMITLFIAMESTMPQLYGTRVVRERQAETCAILLGRKLVQPSPLRP